MLTKKFCTVLSLSLIFAVLFAQGSVGLATETSIYANKVLVFLRDVVMLDVEKYDVVEALGPFVDYFEQFGELPYTTGKLSMYSDMGVVDVLYTFVGDTLVSCSVEPNLAATPSGVLQYRQQVSTDLDDAAAEFLQRYCAYTDDSSFDAMSSILDEVDVTKDTIITSDMTIEVSGGINDTTKLVGNIKLEVSNNDIGTLLRWWNNFNGADFTSLSVEFRKGAFFMFSDDRSYRKIGGTDVNFSEDDAIDIALKRAEDYSYFYKDAKIDNFTIVEDRAHGKLQVKSRYQPLELYPFWMVDLPLDDVYPGSVYFIRVNLWADTGEVIDCRALGYGADGGLPEASPTPPAASASPSSTDTQPENSIPPETAMCVVIAIAVVSIPIAFATILHKRRRK